ncbi:ribosome small subunit-dependent GTPase A [Chengkuizengella axinellae]|uniref:Small ribosomal subunit biogenesis GTPase RsgA n=1 Tax=Chengkuizengella axinellae TaxID=3064388 RepID=A0ABT9IVI0_9BACL|nr:ribosome small subunit-dependent GTPase A [Chengkuizengella sp. 2205SS18-9]MDP5273370.1 ribosome small subunit-dependent GTPase A [Chengkuizengella sp. 2205SS18-9]
MVEGRIIKALSGYYYVKPHQKGQPTIQCRARGIFRKRETSPLVGDFVMVELSENGEGTVHEILPRTSELIRPPIANVNLAVLVFSLVEPDLNLQLLDKFLVHVEKAGLDAMICFSKYDLFKNSKDASKQAEAINELVQYYESIDYPVLLTSKRTNEGHDELLAHMANKTSVFSGQSGVGKSSLLNAIIPGLTLETNQISSKLGRGKHTTRHVELLELSNGGIVADTPGFSQLDFTNIEQEDLGYYFSEFRAYIPDCKFRGCLHRKEPKCKVIEAKNQGNILESRYEHYLFFLDEISQMKRRY